LSRSVRQEIPSPLPANWRRSRYAPAVLSPEHFRSNLLVKLGEVTHRTHTLPMVLFAPTARCNSRCVSCDWWRADGASDLTLDEIRAWASELVPFGTRVVVLTGGEPLLRTDVMAVADVFAKQGLRLHLLTSGLALERLAPAIAERFGEVIVSLDGHTPEQYRAIRGVDGLQVVEAGVAKLRAVAPGNAIRARSTIHRHNFRSISALATKASAMGLDSISFLAADVDSEAFNRRPALPRADLPPAADLLLSEEEVTEFENVIESFIATHGADLAARRILPGPVGLRRLVAYYRAHLGRGPFPDVHCNAPWSSVMIEANGDVRPCFFHPAVGNVRNRPLAAILTDALPAYRRTLDVSSHPTCERCVCTLRVGLRTRLW
jgi:MoaA/NifB/PqqE/SkfB family radical SAM enzyme